MLMKKYLVTWYGMTDLGASLGLTETVGPVLGALLAENYTDIVVLGFIHEEKSANSIVDLERVISELGDNSQEVKKEFLDLFSNTSEAHQYFIAWLKKKLADAGKNVEINSRPVPLKKLNDTEGIHEAATQSLDAISAVEGQKLVTLYLSPGTPVMAFVWAFSALRYPNLKKRLIGSSQIGKPPENIMLPNDWLEWHGKKINLKNDKPGEYDLMIHLFGEQRMPSLLGIRQFSTGFHVFVTSPQFSLKCMANFLEKDEFRELHVDPYDPENVRSEILDLVKDLPAEARIAFNLTGGTKLMYAGALAACRKINATPFYFDSNNNKTIFLDDFSAVRTKLIDRVDTFVTLNGDDLRISKPGYWSQIENIDNKSRTDLTYELWKARAKIAKLYKKIANFNGSPVAFELEYDSVQISLSDNFAAKININNKTFNFENWPDFARYLSGGWFEEFSYRSLKPLVESGKIKDLRIGMEVSIDDEKGYSYLTDRKNYQELDLVFTDGTALYIVECKAGNVNSEQVMKLQNIVRNFGGMSGVGIISCCFIPNDDVINKKIKDSQNIHLARGDDLLQMVESLINKANEE